MQTSTTATVRVTVQVQVGSTWSDECTQRQVFDQASREAVGMIANSIREGGHKNFIKIVGEPIVDTVTKAYA